MKDFNLPKIIAEAIKEGAKKENLSEEEAYKKILSWLEKNIKKELEKLQ